MAWNVGYENLEIAGTTVEGQWEVDESSAEEAAKSDKTPYLLVGVLNTDNPYPSPSWYTANEIEQMEDVLDVFTGEILEETDEWTEYETVQVRSQELAHIMNRVSEGVSLADFV